MNDLDPDQYSYVPPAPQQAKEANRIARLQAELTSLTDQEKVEMVQQMGVAEDFSTA